MCVKPSMTTDSFRSAPMIIRLITHWQLPWQFRGARCMKALRRTAIIHCCWCSLSKVMHVIEILFFSSLPCSMIVCPLWNQISGKQLHLLFIWSSCWGQPFDSCILTQTRNSGLLHKAFCLVFVKKRPPCFEHVERLAIHGYHRTIQLIIGLEWMETKHN